MNTMNIIVGTGHTMRLRLCARNRITLRAKKKAEEEKHGVAVPVHPEDRETNVTW